MLKVKVTGHERVVKSLEKDRKVRGRGGEEALLKAGIHLERKIKEKLTGSRSGRRYRRARGKRGWHTASAPGEPPAVDTGRLRSSITTGGVERRRRGGKFIRVGTNVEYGVDLEYGKASRRLAPRPFMRPTFSEELKKVRSIIRDGLRRRR